jgi:hypothetical protein
VILTSAQTLGSAGGKAAIHGVGSIITTAGDRFVNNTFYGGHQNLFQGAGDTFLTGAASHYALGQVSKAGSSAWGAISGSAAKAPVDDFTKLAQNSGMGKQIWNAAKEPLKKLGGLAYDESGLKGQVQNGLTQFKSGVGQDIRQFSQNFRW